MSAANWIALGSLALALIIQTIIVAFFLGKLSERLSDVLRRIAKLEADGDGGSDKFSKLLERMIITEERVRNFMKGWDDFVPHVERRFDGLGRQISALTTQGRRGVRPPLADALSD